MFFDPSDRPRAAPLQLAVDALPVPVCLTDRSGRITHANPPYRELVGLGLEQATRLHGWHFCATSEEAERTQRWYAGFAASTDSTSSFVGLFQGASETVLSRVDATWAGPPGDAEHAVCAPGPAGLRDVCRLVARQERLSCPRPDGPVRTLVTGINRLTPRERSLFPALARGASVESLAQQAGVRLRTARNALSSIYGKMSVGSRDGLHALLEEVIRDSHRIVE